MHLQQMVDGIDMTATIQMLKGAPIPRSNLGIIISDFIIDNSANTQAVIANIFYTNLR